MLLKIIAKLDTVLRLNASNNIFVYEGTYSVAECVLRNLEAFESKPSN
jgi:hypothetical protein